jgi:hypothetical protein
MNSLDIQLELRYPVYYSFNGADSSNNLKIDLEPIPEAAHTLSFDIVKYQDS